MVGDDAQLYTIEGVAAGMIMLLTAYLVLNTTSVFTPGDVHIPDMQLEQTVSDALAMMDTPAVNGGRSDLARFVQNATGSGRADFHNALMATYLRSTTGPPIQAPVNDLQYEAQIYYRQSATGSVQNMTFTRSAANGGREYLAREPAVRVTRWVSYDPALPHTLGLPWDNREQALLLEVMVWRG
ncbi:MAG: hypothetical protein GKC04_07205 [Methanomicrobiales archaeon]|nr:hypothetical protein [Methanomicrobiales archaeon]